MNEPTRRHLTRTPKHPKVSATLCRYRTGVACSPADNVMALVLERTLRVKTLAQILDEDDTADGGQDGHSITREESAGEKEAGATASEAAIEAI